MKDIYIITWYHSSGDYGVLDVAYSKEQAEEIVKNELILDRGTVDEFRYSYKVESYPIDTEKCTDTIDGFYCKTYWSD